MKQIDVRFSDQEMAELQSLIGKRMFKYKCDPFIVSPSVCGIVGIAVEDASYAVTNFTEVMDYFGTLEDVGLFKIKSEPFEQIHSSIQNQTMIETPAESIITKIEVINERQHLYEAGILTYEVLVTRGIIFFFEDGYEFSLEKNVWFSENISVNKGYDLIELFSPTSEFEEEWCDDFVGKCEREIITLQA